MSHKSEFAVTLLTLLLMLRPIRAQDSGEKSVSHPGTDKRWSTIESENFTIHYDKGFADDAHRAETYLNKTIEALRREFSAHDPERILKEIECHFYLHPEPNEKASDGMSLCVTRDLDDGRRHAELHFLTPARKNPDSTDSLGELKDENHFYRYVVHEYSTIWLGVIARAKEKGWYANGEDSPNWFWQGYQEYLGMTLSSDYSRKVTFSKYMAAVKDRPDSVLVAYGYKDKTPRIVVEREYTDGFALLAFMHDRYGKQRVQSILRSEKETFQEAMGDSLQMDTASFYEEYQKWLQKWQSP